MKCEVLVVVLAVIMVGGTLGVQDVPAFGSDGNVGTEITVDGGVELSFALRTGPSQFVESARFDLNQGVSIDWGSFTVDVKVRETDDYFGVELGTELDVLEIGVDVDPSGLTASVRLETSFLPTFGIDLFGNVEGEYGRVSGSGSVGLGVWPFGEIYLPKVEAEWRFLDTSPTEDKGGFWIFGDLGTLLYTSPRFGAGIWAGVGVGFGGAEADLRIDLDLLDLSFVAIEPEFRWEGELGGMVYRLNLGCQIIPVEVVTFKAEGSCTFHTTPREPPNQPPVAKAAARAEVDRDRLGEPVYSLGVAGGRMVVPAGVPVEFNGSESYDPDGEELDFVWQIAGETHRGESVTFTFPVVGEWDVVLKVYDPHAARDVALPIRVKVVEIPAGDGAQEFKKYCNDLAATEAVVAGVCGTIATASALTPEPVISKAAAAVFGIQAGVHAIASGVFWLLGNDPADLDYTALAELSVPSLALFDDSDVPDGIADAFVALQANLLLQVGLLRATLASLEREGAASAAGDGEWQVRQLEALIDFVRQLASLRAELSLLSVRLEREWSDAGWPAAKVTRAAVSAM
jgi:hypothetical protein